VDFFTWSGVKDAPVNDFALSIEGISNNWDSVKANLDRVRALMAWSIFACFCYYFTTLFRWTRKQIATHAWFAI